MVNSGSWHCCTIYFCYIQLIERVHALTLYRLFAKINIKRKKCRIFKKVTKREQNIKCTCTCRYEWKIDEFMRASYSFSVCCNKILHIYITCILYLRKDHFLCFFKSFPQMYTCHHGSSLKMYGPNSNV